MSIYNDNFHVGFARNKIKNYRLLCIMRQLNKEDFTYNES